MPILNSSIRIAMAQVNPVVGDLNSNAQLIKDQVVAAQKTQADVVLFPEMVLTGYPVEDLALRPAFRQASKNKLKELAAELKDFKALILVGYLDEAEKPQNCLAVIHEGEVKAKYVKHHLPNYGVFDEFRNFSSGDESLIIRFKGVDIGVAICEDIWQDLGPMQELAKRKPGIVLVPNGSPYERDKDDLRLKLVQKRAAQIGAPVV